MFTLVGPRVAALFVALGGVYFGLSDVDPWDAARDARRYQGPFPVVAHPPCERWGRYWSGGPSARVRRRRGDDNRCFIKALTAVRRFGGVLEHPEASHAFTRYNLTKPQWRAGWLPAGDGIGHVCCVAQGHYGHRARKLTWLYTVNVALPDLDWSIPPAVDRLDFGYHSAEERRRAVRTGRCQRLSRALCAATPAPFRDVLLQMAKSAA